MKQIQHPFMLIIYGPTGVGKTDIALSIAEQLPSEIINMDVGQFYTSLSIGTAKPAWKDSPIPHHLFDIINEPINYTVSEYRSMLYDTVTDITKKNKIPIVVGGSAFYLHALLYPPIANISEQADTQNIQEHGAHNTLWQTLYDIDPKRAHGIEKTDIYRIKRALVIWYSTKTLPSSYKPVYKPEADYILLFVTRERQDLRNRINNRVLHMIQQGWIAEAQKCINTSWQPFLQKKKLIGYSEIFDYLSHDTTKYAFDRMIEVIQAKTRQYAKRQYTFWRKLEREIKKENQYTSTCIGCLEVVNSTLAESFFEKDLIMRLKKRLQIYE